MRGVSYLRVDLFAVYRDASVRLDSYSDLLAAYAQYRDRDVLADQECLSNPPRQHKHGGFLPEIVTIMEVSRKGMLHFGLLSVEMPTEAPGAQWMVFRSNDCPRWPFGYAVVQERRNSAVGASLLEQRGHL